MHTSPHGKGGLLAYDEDTAHTVEVQREVDENGALGSFGFTLLYERPAIVGTIVPGEWRVMISFWCTNLNKYVSGLY